MKTPGVIDGPDVRIHRRFTGTVNQSWNFPQAAEGELLTGAIVDVETTGLDPKHDKIIELAVLTFTYDSTDRIVGIGDVYEGLQDPGQPLTDEIKRLTGLDDTDLVSQMIDWTRVKVLCEPVRLFIAHKAEFDRPFVEAAGNGLFSKRPWACSWNEVAWRDRFPEVTAGSLGAVLAGTRREFSEAHRALDDCWAVLRCLSTQIAAPDGNPAQEQAFTDLLKSARTETRRIWAIDSPFTMKDTLKLGRKYKWDAEREKQWYLDLKESEAVAAEIAWLREHGIKARVTYFGAKDRWSTRV